MWNLKNNTNEYTCVCAYIYIYMHTKRAHRNGKQTYGSKREEERRDKLGVWGQ